MIRHIALTGEKYVALGSTPVSVPKPPDYKQSAEIMLKHGCNLPNLREIQNLDASLNENRSLAVQNFSPRNSGLPAP
jgi:hypothetical protein